ncbi:MAG: hypothetical protein ACFCGT_14040, partial [Sandaracinaceae bacterium]
MPSRAVQRPSGPRAARPALRLVGAVLALGLGLAPPAPSGRARAQARALTARLPSLSPTERDRLAPLAARGLVVAGELR